MSSRKQERIGVWTSLPDTVSADARSVAELLRVIPVPPSEPPNSPDEWRRQNEGRGVMMASAAFQAVLNIRSIERRTVSIDGAEHTFFLPPGFDTERDSRIVLHIHGGGYFVGNAENENQFAAPIALELGCPVLSIRYPLWWEASPPADVDRIVAVYRAMLRERSAKSIALIGVSAGGGLALRSALELGALGEPLPAVLGLATPWTDVSGAGDTFTTLMPYDLLEPSVATYAAGLLGQNANLRSPEYSPIYADFPADFPPTLIATGTRDALLSDCARLQRKLSDTGVVNDLRVYEGMPHAFMAFRLPETDAYVRDLTQFLRRYLSVGLTSS